MALRVVFDTTYFLPAFGIQIDLATPQTILDVIKQFVGKGNSIIVSDVTPLEAFLKAFSVAEKRRDEVGKNRAREGFLSLVNDPSIAVVSHQQRVVFEHAFKIRLKHRDPFDCFVFATALAENALLISEDESSLKYLRNDRIMKWAQFKNKIV